MNVLKSVKYIHRRRLPIFQRKFAKCQRINKRCYSEGNHVSLPKLAVVPITTDYEVLTEPVPLSPIPSSSTQPYSQPHTVLVDASPIVWSSYYAAGPGLSTSSGFKTAALHGFVRTLLKILREFKACDYMGKLAMSSESFRKQLSPTYKSTRPPMDEVRTVLRDAHLQPQDLKKQFQYVTQAVEALNIFCIRQKGYEADDLIATYARKAEENGHRVTVISPDKDLLQLVTQNITVWSPKKKNLGQVFDIQAVTELWGVPPPLIPHVQAVAGDQVDNIHNVPGFGRVKATSLIKEFGTIDNLLEHKHNILNIKDREIITSHAKLISENIKLTTLVTNVPDIPPLSELKRKPMDRESAFRFLSKFEFKMVMDYLDVNFFSHLSGVPPPVVIAPEKPKTVVRTKEQYAPDDTLLVPPEFEALGETKLFTKKKEVEEEIYEEPVFPVIEISENMTPQEMRLTIEKNLPGVTVVNDKESAERVIQLLVQYKDRYHACDTEAIDIDLSEEGPIGHGKILCFSLYVGPDVNFGNGPRIWVDNLGIAEGTLQYFKEYFEDSSILKVWHNYGFDRHMIYNHGIDCRGFGGDTMHMARLWDASRSMKGGYSLEGLSKEILEFGKHRIKKDGNPAKEKTIPDLQELQRSPENVLAWLDYSTLDAEATWYLREALHRRLCKMVWEPGVSTMWDFYQSLWMPFGELLTDLERAGIRVDVPYVNDLLVRARTDQAASEKKFIEWASKYCPDCKYMNPSSDAQKQQLLFAPAKNIRTNEEMPVERVFKVPNTEGIVTEGRTKPLRDREITIRGFGLEPEIRTLSGWPAVSAPVIKKLAGDPPSKYGKAKEMFDSKGMDGAEACAGLAALSEVSSIDTLICSFIQPLPGLVDAHNRVHCSLNLNTETGRLSARKPNLQNQPAYDKDRYKLRKAFTCEPGNALVVADYGQLELRLLAHVTNCKSMIEAFKSGGDFHSRTALGMYDYIKKDIEAGGVLLEWDSTKGKAPVPLLKDKYATERRKAKILNFSIAYGKTVHGLAKDWGVSAEEAKDTLEKWYADRPEVKAWQLAMISYAKETGCTRTLLGRYRPLPLINSRDRAARGHCERAAINTPLQGGASDIMVCAMLKLHRDETLKRMGWRQLLQIHDELIFEGPKESAQEAKKRIVEIMEHPLDAPLLIDLVVDAKTADNWYEAK